MEVNGYKIEPGANLQHADLEGANLQHANLEGARLQHANLQHANLQHAHLWFAKLHHANLERANLTEADLHAATLHHANLERANLTGANFRTTDFKGVSLRGASVGGVKLEDTEATEKALRVLLGYAEEGLHKLCRAVFGAPIDEAGDEIEGPPQPELVARLRSLLEELPERQRRVISMRFGFGELAGKKYTLEEVAYQEGATREWVRLIEARTLARMRHPRNTA